MPFKENFDISEEILYLNSPSNGLLPKHTKAWRNVWDKDFFDTQSQLRDQQPEFIADVKQTVARFFQSDLDSTFLTPNFSFGYSTLIDLLPRHYSYLVLTDEYPSLQYPIINRRLKHTVIKPEEDVEFAIEQAVDEYNPDVFIFSMVQYITGLKIDLEFIKRLKRRNPSLLIIADGTQFLGTEPFNFKDSGIDALSGSGYKWLLSGYGNGFLLMSEGLTKRLQNILSDVPLPKVAMWKHKGILNTFFEPGHQDTLSHGTLKQSILKLEEIGLNNIQKQIQEVIDVAYPLFAERNLLLPEIKDRAIRSPLINIQVDPQLYDQLTKNGIICFPRGTGIRIGFHVYNDIQDVHRLVEIIDSIR